MSLSQTISPMLEALSGSLASSALSASKDGAGGATGEMSALFSQALQSAIAQNGGAADDANLGLLLASMIQNGEDSEGIMTLLMAALAQENARRTQVRAAGVENTPVAGPAQGSGAGANAQVLAKSAQAYERTQHAVRYNPSVFAFGTGAQAYRSAIDRFDVENNRRYAVNKQGRGDTYCNLFVTDVTAAMRAEIPHFIDKATGEPKKGPGPNVVELSANDMNNWLHRYGAKYGWHRATPEVAQAYANAGRPSVTSWKNPAGHGHIQMVSPSADGKYNHERGVAIAQAGRKLIGYGYIDQVFGAGRMGSVEYYVHD